MRTTDLTAPAPVSLRIQAIVQENPGIHFRALGRAAALNSTGQLRHHLDRLARRGAVSEVADGRYRRYFPATHAADLQPHLARLSRPVPRRIATHLLSGPMSRTALRRSLECADSTLGYHLQRMKQQGDVQHVRDMRGPAYALVDPERVRRILRAQESVQPRPLRPFSDLGIEMDEQAMPFVLPAPSPAAPPLAGTLPSEVANGLTGIATGVPTGA